MWSQLQPLNPIIVAQKQSETINKQIDVAVSQENFIYKNRQWARFSPLAGLLFANLCARGSRKGVPWLPGVLRTSWQRAGWHYEQLIHKQWIFLQIVHFPIFFALLSIYCCVSKPLSFLFPMTNSNWPGTVYLPPYLPTYLSVYLKHSDVLVKGCAKFGANLHTNQI